MPRYDKNPVLSPAFAAALREPPARTRRRCLVAQLTADTKRTHQKQQARRLASIQRLSTTPICSRNSVADDRACTRVTLPNLHGKEGVEPFGREPTSTVASLTDMIPKRVRLRGARTVLNCRSRGRRSSRRRYERTSRGRPQPVSSGVEWT